jgi:hypothetical protein
MMATPATRRMSSRDRLGDTDPRAAAADSAICGATVVPMRVPAATPTAASTACSAAMSSASRAGVRPATCSRVSSLASLTSREPSRVTISSTAAISISTAKNSISWADWAAKGEDSSRIDVMVLAHHPWADPHSLAGTGPALLRRSATASAREGSCNRIPIDHHGPPTGSIASYRSLPANTVPGMYSG